MNLYNCHFLSVLLETLVSSYLSSSCSECQIGKMLCMWTIEMVMREHLKHLSLQCLVQKMQCRKNTYLIHSKLAKLNYLMLDLLLILPSLGVILFSLVSEHTIDINKFRLQFPILGMRYKFYNKTVL